VTNLDGDICEIEAWFYMGALVEERIKDSKLGLALGHMPSCYEAVNALSMWAALLGLNISAWLQGLTGHDQGHDGRAQTRGSVVSWSVCQRVSRDTPGGPRSTPLPSTMTAPSPPHGSLSTRCSPVRARSLPSSARPPREASTRGAGSSNDKNPAPHPDASRSSWNGPNAVVGEVDPVPPIPVVPEVSLLADMGVALLEGAPRLSFPQFG